MRIWDKKTATNRSPLRRVFESDIAPSPRKDNASHYRSAQRSNISIAMHITRERAQFPAGEKGQNMHEFIEQKKEMFNAELAFNSVQEEIKNLDVKKDRRELALGMS